MNQNNRQIGLVSHGERGSEYREQRHWHTETDWRAQTIHTNTRNRWNQMIHGTRTSYIVPTHEPNIFFNFVYSILCNQPKVSLLRHSLFLFVFCCLCTNSEIVLRDTDQHNIPHVWVLFDNVKRMFDEGNNAIEHVSENERAKKTFEANVKIAKSSCYTSRRSCRANSLYIRIHCRLSDGVVSK